MSNDTFQIAYNKRPLSEFCSKEVTIDVVGDRCIYINDHRVQGGKPYASESLYTTSRRTTVRDILDAFSAETIQAYLAERITVNAYCAGLRNYRDAQEQSHAE